MLALTSILQKEFGLHYNTARIDETDWLDSRDILIHGLLGPTRTGTCSSMPVLVVAIGRRLDYPLHLVHTTGHLFVRWESAETGERWNIEFNGNGMGHNSDDFYREWPAKWSAELIALEASRGDRCMFLRNLNSREEFAVGLSMRGHCLEANLRWEEAFEAYSAAAQFAPNHTAYGVFANEVQSKLRGADTLLSQLSHATADFNPNLPMPGIVQVNAGWSKNGIVIGLAKFVAQKPPRNPPPPSATVLLQMELEFPGVGVSITLKPGGIHEARTEVDRWAGEAGHSAAVPGREGADLGSLRRVRSPAEPALLLAGATV